MKHNHDSSVLGFQYLGFLCDLSCRKELVSVELQNVLQQFKHKLWCMIMQTELVLFALCSFENIHFLICHLGVFSQWFVFNYVPNWWSVVSNKNCDWSHKRLLWWGHFLAITPWWIIKHLFHFFLDVFLVGTRYHLPLDHSKLSQQTKTIKWFTLGFWTAVGL